MMISLLVMSCMFTSTLAGTLPHQTVSGRIQDWECCRWGETQSCAPNQPNQIHTTPDTEPRRSRTKNPRQTSCIWFNRQPILLQSSPIKLPASHLALNHLNQNSIKTLILHS